MKDCKKYGVHVSPEKVQFSRRQRRPVIERDQYYLPLRYRKRVYVPVRPPDFHVSKEVRVKVSQILPRPHRLLQQFFINGHRLCNFVIRWERRPEVVEYLPDTLYCILYERTSPDRPSIIRRGELHVVYSARLKRRKSNSHNPATPCNVLHGANRTSDTFAI